MVNSQEAIQPGEAEYRKEREQIWQGVSDLVDNCRDKLGYPIESGIKPVVIGLNAHGINTTMSCEGHTDRGRIYPWVDVGFSDPSELFVGEFRLKQPLVERFGVDIEELDEAAKNNPELAKELRRIDEELNEAALTPECEEARRKKREHIVKTQALLDEFYNARKVSEEIKLHMDQRSLHSGPNDNKEFRDKRQLFVSLMARRLPEYQTEMTTFAEFLKQKFFQ